MSRTDNVRLYPGEVQMFRNGGWRLPFASRGSLRLLRLIPLSMALGTQGCTWSGPDSYRLCGPTFYRISGAAGGAGGDETSCGTFLQTLRFPFDGDVGDQWSLRVGQTCHTVSAPAITAGWPFGPSAMMAGLQASEPLDSGAGAGEVPAWRFSPFYKKIPTEAAAFSDLTHTGFQVQAGKWHNGVTLGYSRQSAHAPEADSLTFLKYDPRKLGHSQYHLWRCDSSAEQTQHDLQQTGGER